MIEEGRARRTSPAVAALVAVTALLPFLGGLASGSVLYFRDLSSIFIPLRRFLVEGLRRGEIRYWNPLLHEGVPVPYPAISYPFDLLQVVLPDERGLTLLLALHVPLAALAFWALARSLGLSRTAAAGGAFAYALGGFSLSCVNLYVYLEALAWAPLVVLALLRVAERGWRWTPAAAAATAVALSSLGAEVVLQTVFVGVVLGLGPRAARRAWRMVVAVVLGLGLAAPTLLVMLGIMPGTGRGLGFDPAVVLAHSIHPFTYLQTLVGGLYGDLGSLPNRWWGQNFFPKGFPYILSLYLGATVLSLACAGARCGRIYRRRLAALAVIAAVVSLGRWAGLGRLAEALALVRAFRFPTKVFFTVHLAVALLAALGLEALGQADSRPAWRRLAWTALGLGGLLVVGPPALGLALPESVHRFQDAFFAQGTPWPERLANFGLMVDDARAGGVVAAAAGALALALLGGRVRRSVACPALVGLIAADLLRTGVGLNPMAARSLFQLSTPMNEQVAQLRRRGRVFTCDIESSPAYWRGRSLRSEAHDVWTFAVDVETLMPNLNMMAQVPTALSVDMTSLIPMSVTPSRAGCASFGAIADQVRAAAVSDVISLDPLDDPNLHLRAVVAPPRIAPLMVWIYGLERPLPLRFVARLARPARNSAEAEAFAHESGFSLEGGVAVEGRVTPTHDAGGRIVSVSERPDRIEMEVEADRPTLIVLRQTYVPGWSARVNGQVASVLRADGRHQAVEIPAGWSRVVLSYAPPGLRSGLAIGALSLAVLCVLGIRGYPDPAADVE